MTTLAILNSPIPAGGFGRPLTSTERQALRAAGHSVSDAAIVVSAGADYVGHVYNPEGHGRFASANIRVETRD